MHATRRRPNNRAFGMERETARERSVPAVCEGVCCALCLLLAVAAAEAALFACFFSFFCCDLLDFFCFCLVISAAESSVPELEWLSATGSGHLLFSWPLLRSSSESASSFTTERFAASITRIRRSSHSYTIVKKGYYEFPGTWTTGT